MRVINESIDCPIVYQAASYLPKVRIPVVHTMEEQHNEEHSKQVMCEEEDGMAVQHALDRTASCSQTTESAHIQTAQTRLDIPRVALTPRRTRSLAPAVA
jgi:hypothetical protein